MLGKYIIAGGCVSLVITVLLGCAGTPHVDRKGGATIGKAASKPTNGKTDKDTIYLRLEASCRTERIHDRDEVLIEARLVNAGKEPICIRRLCNPAGFFSFRLTDSAGRQIKGRVLSGWMALSHDKQDFVVLDPGNFYGSQFRLVPTVENDQRYYSLVSVLNGVQQARFALDTPGRFSVSISYGNRDDGHLAGVRAWHGGGPSELHSPKIWSEIER